MKKISVLLTLVLAIGFGKMSFAQENAVKMNIFSLAFGTFNVAYERSINDVNTAQLGVFYMGYKIGDTKLTGLAITPEFRHYFDESLHGFYIAPFLRYQNLSLSTENLTDIDTAGNIVYYDGKASYNSFGGGLIAGHQWVLGDHFTIDIFLGPSYNVGTIKVTEGNEDDFSLGSFDGFGLRFGLTFGFAF